MTQMLGLSEKEFEIIMVNMLRSLKEKQDNMHEQMRNISRDGNSQKVINVRNQDHSNRNEECLDGLISTHPRKESLSLKIRQKEPP